MTVQKLVLMVQPVRLQGLIWQAVLKSQQISVIWESPETNLAENLDQLKAAGLVLPDLLILDMQSTNLKPYAFCRWCRELYPHTKVVLTNSGQAKISLSERQWAVNQGASDLLPGFRQENLVSGVAASVKRILEILDSHPLNNGALISVLLTIKRQLDEKASGMTRSPKAVPPSTPDQNGHLMISTLRPSVVAKQEVLATGAAGMNGNGMKNDTNGNNRSPKNGFGAMNGKSKVNSTAVAVVPGEPSLTEDETVLEDPNSPGPRPPQASQSSVKATPKPAAAAVDPAHPNQHQRRYRGLYY
jgi:CheY-like chemotaxis protein